VGLLAKAGKLGKVAGVADDVVDAAKAVKKVENAEDVIGATQKAKAVSVNPAIKELDDKVSAVQRCPVDDCDVGAKNKNRKNIKQRTAEEVNSEFPETYSPPYEPGTRITEFTTKEADQFVRVHGTDNTVRPWMMRKEAVDGLSPEQIQHKYSLPNKPTHISDVIVPEGTRIRTGKVEANFEPQGGGGQGATQYQWIGTKVPKSAVTNTRPIK
jgi:hypothetical protein